MSYIEDEIYRKYGLRCKNQTEEKILADILNMKIASVCPSGCATTRTEAVDEILMEVNTVNENLEKIAKSIIGQNMIILGRMQELLDKLEKLEKISTNCNSVENSETLEEKLNLIDMKINFLLDNKK